MCGYIRRKIYFVYEINNASLVTERNYSVFFLFICSNTFSPVTKQHKMSEIVTQIWREVLFFLKSLIIKLFVLSKLCNKILFLSFKSLTNSWIRSLICSLKFGFCVFKFIIDSFKLQIWLSLSTQPTPTHSGRLSLSETDCAAGKRLRNHCPD